MRSCPEISFSSFRSRDSVSGGAQQHWSRDNSVLDYRIYGRTDSGYSGHSTGTGFRRYNNPLHMFFSETFERTRSSVESQAELAFNSSFGTTAAGLTRIDESSLTGQLNLISDVGGRDRKEIFGKM